jgi:hypothetical protein
MARPDGRIEPGQPLRGAISAKAWNRAQDAADLVLGAGTGIEAGVGQTFSSRLVAPVQVQIPFNFTDGLPVGMAVSINNAVTRINNQTLGDSYSGVLAIEYLRGQLTYIGNYDSAVSNTLGISIDGSNAPALSLVVVPVVIAGLAVVRVRRFDDSHRFAISPIRRISEAGVQRHFGILDSHPCACESSVRVVSYAGAATTFQDDTNAPIVWAVVIV